MRFYCIVWLNVSFKKEKGKLERSWHNSDIYLGDHGSRCQCHVQWNRTWQWTQLCVPLVLSRSLQQAH